MFSWIFLGCFELRLRLNSKSCNLGNFNLSVGLVEEREVFGLLERHG